MAERTTRVYTPAPSGSTMAASISRVVTDSKAVEARSVCVVVPAPLVPDVARACARKGVGGMVVITAGFRETGEAGRALEDELLAVTREAGMRVVGPNCMGLLNSDPDVRLNASFAAARPLPGNVAFVSQSGALGEAILAQARELGLGLSYFVSVGNRADVSTNELLEY